MRTLKYILLYATLPSTLIYADEERNNLNIICVRDRTRSIGESIKGRRSKEAAELLHRILTDRSLIEVEKGRYLAAHLILPEKMKDYPEKVREHLKELQRTEVERLLKRRLTVKELVSLADRFPFSGYRRKILLYVGDLLFEQGEISGAFRIYLHTARTTNPRDGDVYLRIAFTAALMGKKEKALIYASFLPERSSLGGENLSRRRLKQLLKAMRIYEQSGEPVYKPSVPAVSEKLRHPLKRKFRIRLSDMGGVWGDDGMVLTRNLLLTSPTIPFFPTYDNGRLYLPTTKGVIEVNLENGKKYFMRCFDAVSLRDADMLYCPSVTEEEIFLSLPVRIWDGESFRGIPVRASLPQRAVAIFDKKTRKFKGYLHNFRGFLKRFGKKKWSFVSSPVVFKNRVYCEIKCFGNTCTSYIAVFDLVERSLIKAIAVCSNGVELTMFGYDAREPLSTPPASDGENIYIVTNLGTVFAFSLITESIVWLREYSQMRIRAADGYFPQFRTIHWTARPPVVEDGLLIFTPLDSEYAYAVETDTGRLLWRLSYNTAGIGANALLGVSGDSVVFSGRKIGLVGLRNGKLRKTIPLPASKSYGLGAVTKEDEVIVPTTRSVITVELESENIRYELQGLLPGNILLRDRYLFVVSKDVLHIYEQGR